MLATKYIARNYRNISRRWIKTLDVAVVGGGIMGSSSAYHLMKEKRDFKVGLFEQFELGHIMGSSHGDARLIRPTYPDETYVGMCMISFEGWDELSDEVGLKGDDKLQHMTGGLEIGTKGSDAVRLLEETLIKMGLQFSIMDGGDISKSFPQFSFDSDFIGIYCEKSGVLRADDCLKAYNKATTMMGGLLFPHHTLKSLSKHPDSDTFLLEFEIKSGEIERVESKEVVLTAGPWTSSQKLVTFLLIKYLCRWDLKTSRYISACSCDPRGC